MSRPTPFRVTYGQPYWADVTSTDFASTVAFYCSLFGWRAEPLDTPSAPGYTLFYSGRHVVAGGEPIPPEKGPAGWTTFLYSDDAGSSAERIVAAGGTVLFAPEPVLNLGTIALARDPAGATFGIWEPDTMMPANEPGVPGRLVAAQLVTPDPAAAKAFYDEVFQARAGGPDDAPETSGWPDMPNVLVGRGRDAGAAWAPYLGVASVAETSQRVLALGGRVIGRPADEGAPPAICEAFEDPLGIRFAVVSEDAVQRRVG